jgi:hypothetical protein
MSIGVEGSSEGLSKNTINLVIKENLKQYGIAADVQTVEKE